MPTCRGSAGGVDLRPGRRGGCLRRAVRHRPAAFRRRPGDVAERSAALLESNRRRAAEQHRRRAAQWRGRARAAGVRHYQDHAQDRPTRDRVLGSAGPPSLGDRAVAGVAGGLPAVAGPLRAARGPPARVPPPCLRAGLPQRPDPAEGMHPTSYPVRRWTSQAATPSRTAARAASSPASISWKVQNRSPGWYTSRLRMPCWWR